MSDEATRLILDELIAIRADIARLGLIGAGKEKLCLNSAEAMELVELKSRSAFCRFAKAAKLKAYRQGKYRRADVVAAINRMSLKAS